MYVLMVCSEAPLHRSTIHLVDEQGSLAWSGPAVQDALCWLDARGEVSVVALTDVGPELFLIEPCEGLQMTLPSISLRRAHHGHCCDLPDLPGLGPDPALRARVLEDRQETAAERRAQRARSVQRATA